MARHGLGPRFPGKQEGTRRSLGPPRPRVAATTAGLCQVNSSPQAPALSVTVGPRPGQAGQWVLAPGTPQVWEGKTGFSSTACSLRGQSLTPIRPCLLKRLSPSRLRKESRWKPLAQAHRVPSLPRTSPSLWYFSHGLPCLFFFLSSFLDFKYSSPLFSGPFCPLLFYLPSSLLQFFL